MLDTDTVSNGCHQQPAKHRRVTMSFKHHGLEVCRVTFLFLHDIGKDHLQNVKDHCKAEGILVRINKSTKQCPHHVMPFIAIKYVMTFLNNYV